MFEFMVAVTPIEQSPRNWVDVAPYESLARGGSALAERTRFLGVHGVGDIFAGLRIDDTTSGVIQSKSFFDEEADSLGGARSTFPALVSNQETDAERIARQRLKVLVSKMARNDKSKETLARLEILNRRLSGVTPRVTAEQVSALEQANLQLAKIRAAREERAARLGL